MKKWIQSWNFHYYYKPVPRLITPSLFLMHTKGKAIEVSVSRKNEGVRAVREAIWAGVQFSRNSILVFNDQIKIWENRGLWTVKPVPVWDCYYWKNTSLLSFLSGSCCVQSIITSGQQVRLTFPHLVDMLRLWKAKFILNVEVTNKWLSLHVDLAPIVRRLDNAIHWINCCPVDKGWQNL